MTTPALVVGIGHERAGDDAAGLLAARELRDMDLPGVDVVEEQGDLAGLESIWRDAETLLIFDAVTGAGAPAGVLRYDASREPLPVDVGCGASSHGFGIAAVLEVSRMLRTLPGRVVVYAIPGRDFAPGTAASDDVRARAREAARRAREDLGIG